MKIEIKKAGQNDLEGLIELFNKNADYHNSLDSYYKPSKDQIGRAARYINKKMLNADSLILIAKDSNKTIGMMIVSIQDGNYNSIYKRIGFISKAFLLEEYREKNITKKMFEEIISWFKQNKVEHIELGVYSHNELGIKAWEGFGFKEKRKIMTLDI